MKLTLTREQIPLARETVAWLRDESGAPKVGCYRGLPGYLQWLDDNRAGAEDDAWADALEAAITEAERPMQVITLAKQGDADERRLWLEACINAHRTLPAMHWGLVRSEKAAEVADTALKRYRKAFCTGMPSDQKGSR